MKTCVKILSLVLAAVFCVGCLASCGAKNYAENNTEFFIGGSGPLTGNASSYGISVNKGAQIALEEINEAGGLNGIKFKFEMKDDQAETTPAANAYHALYEAGMQASIVSVTSGSCIEFADSAQKDGVFALTPSASDAKVIATGDHIFRVCFGDPQQGTIAADSLTKDFTKIGVVYDTSDTYSSGIYEAFLTEMAKLGKTKNTDFVETTFDADNKQNFSTQITTLKAAGCDVIFLPIYYTEAGLIAKAAATAEYNVPIFGCDGLDGIAGQIDDTVTVAISYITPFDVNSQDTLIKTFVEKYQAKYNELPDQFAADGYDALMAIYAAMKKADVKDVTISAADLGKILVDTFTSSDFSYTGLTGQGMTWAKDGYCEKAPNIVEVVR
ncbi:MAG: ABC transporter substrate-binding protein [Clostridia bacterium]|nr:ABC transporter substrate-binding protein [Clostridia bacterium]